MSRDYLSSSSNHNPSTHRGRLPVFLDPLRLCLDPIFPAPLGFTPKKDHLRNPSETNQFELVFD